MAELLEIRDAGGAFERLEEWRGDRGFFASGGEEVEESWVKARPLLAAVGSPLPVAVTT